MRTRISLTAALIVALLATLLATLVVATPASAASGRRTKVVNCMTVRFEPKSFVIACGDGNIWASKLHYSSWTKNRAAGHGVLNINTCNPNCASGTGDGLTATVAMRPRT